MDNSDRVFTVSAAELKNRRAESRTDWKKVDALKEDALEQRIAEDEDESGLSPDWIRAQLVLPEDRTSTLKACTEARHQKHNTR